MKMPIDEHIGVIEDLKSTMSVCMPEPEKTQICTSLNKAMETMHKYQKITEIVAEWKVDSWTDGISYDCMVKISEVLEYGHDNIASETRNP